MVLFIQEYIQNSDDFIKKCLKKYIQINNGLILDYDFSKLDIVDLDDFINKVKIVREGKPYLYVDNKQFLHFNLSHSGNVMVAVFSDSNVGVDIEKHKERDYTSIAKREGFTSPKNLQDFYNMWTKYEAIAKLSGEGIKQITSIKDVSIAKNIDIIDGYSIAVAPYENLIVSILT